MKKKFEIFHVHTYRCKHASNEKDECYVKKAISMGVKKITFTDHAPFPGNPFGNRMDISELEEYVDTLKDLKKRYEKQIEVSIGLELEYLKKFNDYYRWLYQSNWFDVLMIGQHFYECEDGSYSFSLQKDILRTEEAEGICKAVIEGMQTGYFNIVAHPDRMFRKCTQWTEQMEHLANDMIQIASERNIILEHNLASMERDYQYWSEFWRMVPEDMNTIIGTDAHSSQELQRFSRYIMMGDRKIC